MYLFTLSADWPGFPWCAGYHWTTAGVFTRGGQPWFYPNTCTCRLVHTELSSQSRMFTCQCFMMSEHEDVSQDNLGTPAEQVAEPTRDAVVQPFSNTGAPDATTDSTPTWGVAPKVTVPVINSSTYISCECKMHTHCHCTSNHSKDQVHKLCREEGWCMYYWVHFVHIIRSIKAMR